MTRLLRIRGAAIVVAAAATAAACAPMRVLWFPERGVDFSAYHSYSWAPAVPVPTGDARLDSNPFFHEHLRGAVDKGLAARGIEKVDDEPDLLLHYHVSVDQTIDLSGVDRYTRSDRDREPDVYNAGTIVIDLLDARTNRLIWRGWAESSIDGVIDDQAWMEERIDDAVARVLAKLPKEL